MKKKNMLSIDNLFFLL